MAENRNAIAIGVPLALSIVAIFIVGLRFQARRIKHAGYGADDWTILLGLIFSLTIAVACMVGAISGLIGRHDYDAQGNKVTTFDQYVVTNKAVWVMQWNAALGPGFTKISVLLFYKRVFVFQKSLTGNVLTYALWTWFAISVIWTTAFFFANFFGCISVGSGWHFINIRACANSDPMWMTMAISDVIINAFILTLPWLPLRKLRISSGRKVLLVGIFLLGGFTVLAGCFRAYYFHTSTTSSSRDQSYERSPGLYWAVIEACVGVVSACLPCLGPIFAQSSVRSIIDRVSSFGSRVTGGTSSSSHSRSGYDRAGSDTGSTRDVLPTREPEKEAEATIEPPQKILRTTTWSMVRTDSAPESVADDFRPGPSLEKSQV